MPSRAPHARRSLLAALLAYPGIPVIAELKPRSPLEGPLRDEVDVKGLLLSFQRGGACAVSVLTEPDHFGGSLQHLPLARRLLSLPLLMKDVVVDPRQLGAAAALGADAVLLIEELFSRGLTAEPLEGMVALAHSLGLEVLLEVHDERGLRRALASEAEVIGINNRDLSTLRTSLEVSRRLLRLVPRGRPIVCESGLGDRKELLELRALGASGFLIGTSLMKAADVEGRLRLFTAPEGRGA